MLTKKMKSLNKIYTISAIIILMLWIAVSIGIRSNSDLFYIRIGFTSIIFIILSYVAICAAIPEDNYKLRHYLLAWIVVKIIIGLIYFDYFYVQRTGDITTIVEYGDSFTHHYTASDYSAYWLNGKFLTNPLEISSQVEQWGYDYFLAIIYFITGSLPEIAIIINSFFALILCILSYKLFIITLATPKEASTGVIFLSLMPMVWSLSSLIYKDMLLFVVVVLCVIQIFKLMDRIEIPTFLLFILLLLIILVFRYSYVYVMLSCLMLGSMYMSSKSLKGLIILIPFVFISLEKINDLQLLRFGGLFDVGEYIQKSQAIATQGGSFMTGAAGKITINNFMYAIPLKSFYLTVIPFPWFNSNSFIEGLDQAIMHFDAIYFLTVIFILYVSIANKNKYPINKERKLLLILGLIFFGIPLFMFFPGRRYISLAVPFLIAFSLPYLHDKKIVLRGIYTSIVIILSSHIAYLLIS